jgi:GntR family transcriptional regulator/MocR family aminotransferase
MLMAELSRNALADAIQTRIMNHEWHPGQRLPTTKEFAAAYDVSEDLVYHAFVLLIDRGIVVGRRGGRRYVAGADPEQTGDVASEDGTPQDT